MPRPRPKRARAGAAATRAASIAAETEHNQSSATPPPIVRPTASAAKDNQTQAGFDSDIYDVSDREKERMKQRSAKKGAASTDHTLELNSDETRVLESARRKRDGIMARLDNLTSTTTADDDGEEAECSRRESVTNSARPPRLTDASGLDLDDDSEMFGSLDDSLGLDDDETEHAIDESTRGGRSANTSTFSVGMFRMRRPRQSSVAGRNDAPIRPSSRSGMTPSVSTTLDFGNFRRRAREPSILGSVRKQRTQRSVSRGSQASRNRDVLDRDDDAEPDGESPPFKPAKGATDAVADSEVEASPIAAFRKRKSLETHENNREKRQSLEQPGEGEPAPRDEEDEVIHQSIEIEGRPPVSSPLSSIRGDALERLSTPTLDNDPDMAPPLSSSEDEASSPVCFPPLESLAANRKHNTRPQSRQAAQTPELVDNDDASSTLSSPPSLTHSPNFGATRTRGAAAAVATVATKKKKPTAAPAPKPITTADLTSLLPRRRHTRSSAAKNNNSNDPFDLDASENEDYSLPSLPKKTTSKKKQPLSKASGNAKGKETAASAKAKKAKRTYGSLRVEDQENLGEQIVVGSSDNEAEEQGQQEGEEESRSETSVELKERLGEELQKAYKKFKEIDKYELTFEVVERGSSPDPMAR
ncbi:hypothetical protein QBC35DRAFT_490326 [Podospora australis]|uniref:Uncharacterized protein n=1 Tax=Podospora australis TaxID=1536484 RepID=A0AAN6X1L5_9PEZI|nr:hypothetical protein QBC35DRAFT_490326 [Podospora australis]